MARRPSLRLIPPGTAPADLATLPDRPRFQAMDVTIEMAFEVDCRQCGSVTQGLAIPTRDDAADVRAEHIRAHREGRI